MQQLCTASNAICLPCQSFLYRPVLPGSPGDPGVPCPIPGSPVSPGAPIAPVAPVSPDNHGRRPLSPVGPVSPVAPGGPGGPIMHSVKTVSVSIAWYVNNDTKTKGYNVLNTLKLPSNMTSYLHYQFAITC